VALLGESKVLAGERLHLVLAEGAGRRRLGRAFAIFAPGPGGENSLAVALRPTGELLDDRLFLLVDRAVAADRHVEQQGAVLRDDVRENLSDLLCALVAVPLVQAPVVVPV